MKIDETSWANIKASAERLKSLKEEYENNQQNMVRAMLKDDPVWKTYKDNQPVLLGKMFAEIFVLNTGVKYAEED